MSRMKVFQFVTLALLLALSSGAEAASLRDFTLIATGNVTSSQEVEGSAFIGGNLLGNGINTGVNAPFLGPDDRSFVIAGDVLANFVHVNAGYAVVNSTTANVNRINMNSDQAIVSDSGVAALVGAYEAEMTSQSAYFRSLAANSLSPVLGDQPAPVIFVATPDPVTGVAVFEINASLLADHRAQSVQFQRNGASSIVVNVSGASATLNANFIGDLSEDQQANTIFNFFEATGVNLNRSIFGATLAPNAEVFIGATTEGAVFARAVNLANGEIHGPNYSGILAVPIPPTAVPEPGTLVLSALGVPLVLVAARARRRRAA